MSNPLVFYLADSLDARAGAELIRERWPGAELRACVGSDYDSAQATLRGHVWVLGLPAPEWAGPGAACTVVDPTPDASIAMQVWRLIYHAHHGEEPDEDPRVVGYATEPEPPTWLRYLDDAITGRWALPDSRAVWAAMLSDWHESPGECIGWWSQDQDCEWPGRSIVTLGKRLLSARERWEDGCRSPEGCEFITRLRAERDELRGWMMLANKVYADLANTGKVVRSEHEEISKIWLKLAGVDHD